MMELLNWNRIQMHSSINNAVCWMGSSAQPIQLIPH
jgi:hypothetical protein